MSERQRAGDPPFDRRAAREASVRELDLEYFESHYLPQAVAQEVLEDNRRSLEQQLQSLRLLGGEVHASAVRNLALDVLRASGIAPTAD